MDKTYLIHHGIKGQKWGIRRFQNEDGSLTGAGRRRYDVNEDGTTRLKSSYTKSQNRKGLVKTLIGATVAATAANKLLGTRKSLLGNRSEEDIKNKVNVFASKDGQKAIKKAVFAGLISAVVITSAAKNFINANKNKSFNTTGMGATPERFTGKAKTRNQVIAAQKRAAVKK